MAISFVRASGIVSASAGLFAACSFDAGEPPTSSAESAIALGGHLSGISDADFNAARDNFNLVETSDDGVGPVLNERVCVCCHSNGATGGAREQIERRYVRVTNGIFNNLTNEGGSLRQLQTL